MIDYPLLNEAIMLCTAVACTADTHGHHAELYAVQHFSPLDATVIFLKNIKIAFG